MSAFAQVLQALQSGRLSCEEVLSEIYRQLAEERATPASLLKILEIQQLSEPLPADAHAAIVSRIAAWPEDPTIVTGAVSHPTADRTAGPNVGDILNDRFRLEQLVGEGGMSLVFKAVDFRRAEAGAAEATVAIKVLTEPFSDYFGAPASLQAEAHKLQSLMHPNIVRVIDCDRDGQTVFMSMEYLTGESLQRKLRLRGVFSPDRPAAVAMIVSIANALDYAHQHHIVHGDLKPGNVIVTDAGVVKVIDFGMARFIAPAGEHGLAAQPAADPVTKAVTPRYASPQMLAGHDPEPSDDVYALACIAYEVLSGKAPFGAEKDPKARDPQLAPIQPEGMPVHQYLALAKALAFDRSRRTATVRQFLDEFAAPPRVSIERRWVWVGAAVILAAFVALVLLLALRKNEPVVSTVSAVTSVPGAVIRDCPTCPLLTLLPPGRFLQGAAEGAASASSAERPRHPVIIDRALAMSSNEITVGEFREFVEATQRQMPGCTVYDGRWLFRADANWQSPGFAQTAEHPVACASWSDAVAYADWLTRKSGRRYRLPSASEWEYAARAGGDETVPWTLGAQSACADANVADRSAMQRYPGWDAFPCSDGYVATAPAGSYAANAFGLKDMLGNVFEWVEDCWHDDYVGAPADGSARMDGDCREHELRGGSWFSSPRYVTASYRNRFETGYRSSSVGFRLVREMVQ